jgi:uncharacterized membrane protein
MNIRTIQILASASLLSIAWAALADTYTTIDVPGAVTTDASGINASGEIVGTYTDSSNASHGFRLRDGIYTVIDYPGATSTFAIAVNSRGDVAGFFLDPANQWHGFVLSNGSYFVQDYPAATTGSFTLGISANATLVGEFKVGQAFGQLGFAWVMRHGQYTQLTPPSCDGATPSVPVQAFATSVNPRGDVVGRLIDAVNLQCAWKLDNDGVYGIIQFPGASLTNARGINSKGEVVGVYRLGVNHGFVLPANDLTSFATIDFPGASSTRALGINSCGDIVGTYAVSGPAGTGHGFLLVRDNDDDDCDDE